jgi:hypothetical protein
MPIMSQHRIETGNNLEPDAAGQPRGPVLPESAPAGAVPDKDVVMAAAAAWADARLNLFVTGLTVGGMSSQEDLDRADAEEAKAAEALLAALGRPLAR